MKLGRQFVLSLRTILVRYNFDDNTSIDSSAEGECFAKGSHNCLMSNSFRAIARPCKNVNHLLRTRSGIQLPQSHESHSIPGLKKRCSVSAFNQRKLRQTTRKQREEGGASMTGMPPFAHAGREKLTAPPLSAPLKLIKFCGSKTQISLI